MDQSVADSVNRPAKELTLSEVSRLLPEDARSAAAIERDLDAIGDATRAGDAARAHDLTDRLLASVFSPRYPGPLATDLAGDETTPPGIAECELRALWGDR